MRSLPFKLLLFVALSLVFILMLGTVPAAAAPPYQDEPPNPNLSISDEYCISCHGQPGQTYPLDDGTLLDLYVDPQMHANSVHGSQGYACVQCHTEVGEYPHPPFSAADRREATLILYNVCQRCHAPQYEKANDSVHSHALESGNRNAAVCSDCHTAHAVQDWVDEQTGEALPEVHIHIPQTCALCHNEIYQNYLTSVHGSALTQENNQDVPTCIDCHGVHNIEDPRTTSFRLASPQLCGGCHSDQTLMTKYGVSTDVFDTYVADFHGTTVTIFERQTPDAETNKPVCYDCHGVHNISRADDPNKGLHVKENLLETCQKCHPNAAENFPTAWLSHYIPSQEQYPLVFYVDLFYKFFIPGVLGGMAVLVVLDASRKAYDVSKRFRVRKATEVEVQVSDTELHAGDVIEDAEAAAEPSMPVEEPAEAVELPKETVSDAPADDAVADASDEPTETADQDDEEANNG